MPNYKEQDITGAKWKRSHFVVIENPLDGPKAVIFHEQWATLLSDGFARAEDAGQIRAEFTNPSEVVQLKSPLDDSVIAGATMTFQDIYVAMHSLYLHLAAKRDTPLAQ